MEIERVIERMYIVIIMLSIVSLLSIAFNIFQHINIQRQIADVIDITTDVALDKIAHPNIWPCSMILICISFNMEKNNQVVDFSQYKQRKIVSFNLAVQRAPANAVEAGMNGKIKMIAPGAVYSPAKGVFQWIV